MRIRPVGVLLACALFLLQGCEGPADTSLASDFGRPVDSSLLDAAVDAGPAPDAAALDAQLPDAQVRDAEVIAPYFDRVCGRCHGLQGEGIPGRTPQIQTPVRAYATWVLRNGRSGGGYSERMPAFSERQIDADRLEEIFERLNEAPRPTTGAGLYRRFCGNCHGTDGSNGPIGSSIRGDLEEVIAAARSGMGEDRYWTRGGYMPSWTPDELSDAELLLIKAHLEGAAED